MSGRIVHTFDELNNSTLFDVHRWSEYPEVIALRGQMLEKLGFKGTKKEINHVTVVLLNLYYAYCLDPEMWVLYSRDRNDFNQGQRYNQLFIKYDILIRTVDGLIELGYVDNVNGFHDRRPGGQSFGPKMRATSKLICLIEGDNGVTFNMIGKYVPDELVVLRNADGEDIDYVDSKATEAMKSILVTYNELLEKTYIDIHFDVADIQARIDARRAKIHKVTGEPKDYRLVINLTNKRVRRIFNQSTFNKGGRFYGGWWQNIPEDLRKKIIINRDYTVEIDYSGQHIYLLYAMKGINFADLGKEPYVYPKGDDPQNHRPILKVLLLAAINSKSEEACIKAVQYEINMNRQSFPDELPNLKDLYAMFKEYHEDIADMFCSKLGLKLQRLDSCIAENVVQTMTQRGIPVLVVHDSFICSKAEEDFLLDVMMEAYRYHAYRLQVADALGDQFSSNPIETKTKDITLLKPEALREDDILTDYLAWVDMPQGRRFTNYLLAEDPTTNVVIKVHNERITEVGVELSEPEFNEDDYVL
ncbi:hypothetical protein KP003_06875 [Geomonas nitrogeniifigens]|uniref:hypothetical protein n=1 Tax=Geomonas diazotrophica TaxID=2843197 RepID=UPI001C2CC34C|nr:hypothetical protein [Geomonas nitrogeniifigens]QXE88115.1 hypothetical protein KP003_06875 [Geomonas nitrogeniifigens]